MGRWKLQRRWANPEQTLASHLVMWAVRIPASWLRARFQMIPALNMLCFISLYQVLVQLFNLSLFLNPLLSEGGSNPATPSAPRKEREAWSRFGQEFDLLHGCRRASTARKPGTKTERNTHAIVPKSDLHEVDLPRFPIRSVQRKLPLCCPFPSPPCGSSTCATVCNLKSKVLWSVLPLLHLPATALVQQQPCSPSRPPLARCRRSRAPTGRHTASVALCCSPINGSLLFLPALAGRNKQISTTEGRRRL